jgi:hypothetical protein
MQYYIICKCSICGTHVLKEDFWISENNIKEALDEISRNKFNVCQDHFCEKQSKSIRGALVPIGIKVIAEKTT